ncbi:hypothetical protein G3T14_22110 [Methylobacterium sp. BTF04]|uniref:hypothetical protein n=1 Tax=Methylobacterium sp. BTF04 TaxID=2708300 RepID=UPI0013D37300|nr:hypothetical protein [Methylobacterium sp. BTF04]NEU14773.1 hypothetical protein [Methylobacterium sp. BTF04]
MLIDTSTKPTTSGRKAEFPPADEALAKRGTDRVEMIPTSKASKFGAEKPPLREQRRRLVVGQFKV